MYCSFFIYPVASTCVIDVEVKIMKSVLNKNWDNNLFNHQKKHKNLIIFEKIFIRPDYNLNNNIIQIKRKTDYFNLICDSDELEYDSKRDELFCKKCGLVLRQGFNDYRN